LIRSVQYYASTFKTFTLSFDVTNFQTIRKLKNSKSTYEDVSKYVQIQVVHFAKLKKFGAKCFQKVARNSPNRQTKYL